MSQRNTHTYTQDLTIGRPWSTSWLLSWPRPNAISSIKEGGARLAPRRPRSTAPSSIQSGLPDKLMETNQLSGRTRRALHLPASRTNPLPPPSSLQRPPAAATTSPPTVAPAITVMSRNNRVTAIYSSIPTLPWRSEELSQASTHTESSQSTLICRFSQLNLCDLHHVLTPELILTVQGS